LSFFAKKIYLKKVKIFIDFMLIFQYLKVLFKQYHINFSNLGKEGFLYEAFFVV